MQQTTAAQPQLQTVRQFSSQFPWTEPALRGLIYAAEDRVASGGRVIKGNGLFEAGAIVRVGRRVLIDVQAFFLWVRGQQDQHQHQQLRQQEQRHQQEQRLGRRGSKKAREARGRTRGEKPASRMAAVAAIRTHIGTND